MKNVMRRIGRWLSAQEKSDAQIIAAAPTYPTMVKNWLVFGGIVLVFFAVSHAFFLPAEIRFPLAAVAAVSGGTLLLLRLAFMIGLLPYRYIVDAMLVIAGLVWLNAALRLWMGGEPMQATNLGMLTIAAGILMLRLDAYAVLCVACAAAWVAAFLVAPSGADGALWFHYSLFMVQAFVISGLAFHWRRNALLRQVEFEQERKRARSSEHLSLLAAQSKAIEAERNLRRALDADAAKSMFLANMSHELRTPLNSVVGFAQLLKDRPEIAAQPGRVHEYAECIHSSGTHLLGLINQILDLSRANAGGMSLNETRVDVGDTASEITRLLSPQAAEAKVGLHAHAASGQHIIRGDDLRIRQIVTNLVANAVKFTPAGGRVDVSVGRDGSGLVLEVRDTGIGIAMQDVGRVFEPFVQADGGMNKRHQGTGLGLAITRRLVELHGGTISVKSAPGEGSVFTVRFPVERIEDVPMRSVG
jgi:signal transduction histidine kinase